MIAAQHLNALAGQQAVNYFRLHIGDYEAATVHLSLIEEAIYSRLLRIYYRDERPLPLDLAKVCRLCRCGSAPTYRDAVQSVLSEFFVQRTTGWHNKRADQEILDYQRIRDAGRNAAAIRWHSEGNASQKPIATNQKEEIRTAPLLAQTTAQPKPAKPPKRKPRHPVDEQALDDHRSAWALARLPDVDAATEWEAFWRWHKAEGTLSADWDASWRTWITNKVTRGWSYAKRKPSAGPSEQPRFTSDAEWRAWEREHGDARYAGGASAGVQLQPAIPQPALSGPVHGALAPDAGAPVPDAGPGTTPPRGSA